MFYWQPGRLSEPLPPLRNLWKLHFSCWQDSAENWIFGHFHYVFCQVSTVLLFTGFHLILAVATLKVLHLDYIYVQKPVNCMFLILEFFLHFTESKDYALLFCLVLFFSFLNFPQCSALATTCTRCFILSTALCLPGSECQKWWLQKWVDWDRICKDRWDLDLFHTEMELEQSPVLTNN